MFSPGLGGLEQVFVDYSACLSERGHNVTNILLPNAHVSVPRVEVGNWGQWDPIAVWRLRRVLRRIQAEVVIAHGNRAIVLLRKAARGVCPLIAVNHSINVRRTVGADFVIAINDDMRSRLLQAGQPPERVATLFNMIKRPPVLASPQMLRSPPVIGAMGRFVKKKGFDIFLQALSLLQARGVAFRAILAGAGEEEVALKRLADTLGVSVEFPGWVQDQSAFFAEIDVFVFPSSHDVCPVVLLEAFLAAKPVVLSDCPGPREIAQDQVDSLLFPINDAPALADRITRLLEDPFLAHKLAQAAQQKILTHHTFETAGAQLEAIVRGVAISRSG